MQCCMCLACKNAYVPKQLSDEYVSYCCTCGRGACNSHGSWEVGHFHCALCHATDDGLLAGVKDTFAVRCLSKAFRNQSLLHTNEEAFNDLMLTLCTGAVRNYEEQRWKVQPQEAAGLELSWNDARQLVEAIVLSRVGTLDAAVKVLGQSLGSDLGRLERIAPMCDRALLCCNRGANMRHRPEKRSLSK